jgi:hypothetical protein
MKRLEDYSKDELIEMIEAYNLMTHIKNYNSMNKADLIKEIRNKFDVNENGQIVSKELTAYPTEFKKKVADIADKSEYSENDYNKIRIKISGQRGTIERIKDELGNYDNINKSDFDYDKMVKKKKALEERLQIEKNNLSKMIVLGKKIKEGYEKGVKTYEEEQKKPKLKKMKYTEFMKYYFLKHKGESPKDMMKNASQSWKDIKDKDHTNIINEYENLTKVKEVEKGAEKPKYGIKELKFNKDGLLDISDYRYVVGKRFELDKLMEELKEKIDDTPKTKKYETKLKKMNDDLQKLKDERLYYGRIFNKHITRQSEIDNMPTEDEEEDDIDKKLEDVKKVLEPSQDHLFVSGELVASDKTSRMIKEYVKKNFEPPIKNIKGYIIRMDVDKNNKFPLSINCGQITITPKLFIGPKDDDTFHTFTFTKDELMKYGFKMDYIYKMIDAIKNNKVSFEKSSISITELLKIYDKKEASKSKPKKEEDDIDKKLEDVKKVLEPTIAHLFIDNELVASAKTAKLLKQYVKENYEPPKKNIKGFIVHNDINIKDKFPIIIDCVETTITPKLSISPQGDDASQSFTFTKDELMKYGFKMDYIYKMMKAIKNNLISFEKSSISITELLNLSDKKEASKPKPKKEESKSKPFLTEARKRRLKQQLEQQKKDEEEMIKDIKKEVKKDDNIYEIETSSTKFKKNETEYKDLKFKGILFKNAQIKKQVLKKNGVYHKHLIIAYIKKDEKREDELVHKAFIEADYLESGETAIKSLYIEMVKVFQEFRGQKLTETNFLLLWSYLNTYHKDDLNSLTYVLLQYAATVPVWTTYNRMINEIDFYNPLIDYILQRVIIDENIKLVLHHTFLQEINLYWYKKNTNDYKNFITPDFIISLIENIKDAGDELNEKKKNPNVRENLQLKDNVDYKKVANEIIKQLKK